jgi:hypothetical protein
VFQGGQRHIVEQFTTKAMTRSDTIDVDATQMRGLPPGAKASIVRDLQRRVVLALDSTRVFVPTEAALRFLIAQLPLTESWRGSVAVRSAHVDGAVWQPEFLNLRVAGADTLSFSGRAILCWRLLVELKTGTSTWLVSQSTGETLLVESARDASGVISRTYLIAGPAPETGKSDGVP